MKNNNRLPPQGKKFPRENALNLLLERIEEYGKTRDGQRKRKKIAIELRSAIRDLIGECFYCGGGVSEQLEELFLSKGTNNWSPGDLDEMHRDVQLIVPPPERR